MTDNPHPSAISYDSDSLGILRAEAPLPDASLSYDDAKAYVLEKAPITVPKRFLFGKTYSSQRIESIAARFTYFDTSLWEGELTASTETLLLQVFGLELIRKGRRYALRGARRFYRIPPPQDAVRTLEKLWEVEYETVLRLRQERQALQWIRSKWLKGKDDIGEAVHRDSQARVVQVRERLRLIVIHEYLLIQQIAFPNQSFNGLLYANFQELPETVWSQGIAALLRLKPVPEWLIRERVRSANAILNKVSYYAESALHMEGSLNR